jgi:exodeoxyribonuclease V alpha subunit
MHGQALSTQSDTPTEALSGAVERVTFHSDETGFCVLRVKVRGHEIGQRALSYYLSALKADLDLADEFRAWEQLSDDALLDMEQQLTIEA